MDTKTYQPKEVAVLVRAELKDKLSSQKFSVRTDGYRTVRVGWTDGIAYNTVAQITDFFGGMSFDGMDESDKYHKKTYKGQVCQFYTYTPTLERSISTEFANKIASVVRMNDRFASLVVRSHPSGNAYFIGVSDDYDNNEIAIIRELVKSIGANTFNPDKILSDLSAIEEIYNRHNNLPDNARKYATELKDVGTKVTQTEEIEPLITVMDLSKFQNLWSSDKPVLKIVPDPEIQLVDKEYKPDDVIDCPDRMSQIEIDYQAAVKNHLASGCLENITSFGDYKLNYYSHRYKKWVMEKIDSGDERSIMSLNDWVEYTFPTI